MILNIDKIFEKKIKKFLITSMEYNNVHEIPKLESAIINTNLGTELNKNSDFLSNSITVLENISLQRPKVVSARKSISNFKLKENEKIALICTLRKKRLSLFLTKLIFLTFGQIEDWNSKKTTLKLDGQNNFCFGIDEHLVFPEIGFSFNSKSFGLNIVLKFKSQKRNYIDRLFLLKMLKIL